jgi:asparagine synthetase B (glutamine-hydrolysing)
MCGIHVVISASQPAEISADLRRCLCNRGPDHVTTHETQLTYGAETTHLAFTSSVLALRGDHVAKQPFIDPDTGSIFCWNGEAWKLRHHDVSGNDGEAIAALLSEAVTRDLEEREAAILQVLRCIDGPFAFAFFDKSSSKLYYGRDRLGRRSLVIREEGQTIVLSSITDTPDPQWEEVEADGIYVLDVANIHSHHSSEDHHRSTTRLDWLDDDEAVDFVSVLLQLIGVLCRNCKQVSGTYSYRSPILAGSIQMSPKRMSA